MLSYHEFDWGYCIYIYICVYIYIHEQRVHIQKMRFIISLCFVYFVGTANGCFVSKSSMQTPKYFDGNILVKSNFPTTRMLI